MKAEQRYECCNRRIENGHWPVCAQYIDSLEDHTPVDELGRFFYEFREGDRVCIRTHTDSALPPPGTVGQILRLNETVYFQADDPNFGDRYIVGLGYWAYIHPSLLRVIQPVPELKAEDLWKGDEVVMLHYSEGYNLPPVGTKGKIIFSMSAGQLKLFFGYETSAGRRRLVRVDASNSHCIHPSKLRITKRGPVPLLNVEFKCDLNKVDFKKAEELMLAAMSPRYDASLNLHSLHQYRTHKIKMRSTSEGEGLKGLKIQVNTNRGIEDFVLDIDPEGAVALIHALAEALE